MQSERDRFLQQWLSYYIKHGQPDQGSRLQEEGEPQQDPLGLSGGEGREHHGGLGFEG